MTPIEDIADTLDKLRRHGKIRCYGVSNHTVEQLRAVRAYGPFNACQPPYSLLDPKIEADLLPYCAANRIGVMVYSPLHKGLLTGKYTGRETFTDFRMNHPDFQGDRFRQIAQAVQRLKPMAEKYGLSLYQLILAATLMHPAIQVAVVGIKTPDQIAEAAGAVAKTLERPDYYAIRSALALDAAAKVKDASGKVK